MTWLDLCNLGEAAGWPIALNSCDNGRFALNGSRFLVLHRFHVAVAQFAERQFALRPINLSLFLFEPGQLPVADVAIRRSQRTLDLLAVVLDAGIIDAIR